MGAGRYIKTTIIGRALLIAIVGFYVSLFILRQWLVSPIWLVAVFCILPYAIIYFHRHRRYGIAILVVVNIILGFYVGRSTYLVLGFVAALIGLYQTSNTIYQDVHNKIKVSDFDVFTGSSVSKFVTYMSLVYVFTFMSFYQTFNLTCDGLYYYTSKVVNTALLRNNPEAIATVKGYIADFFTTNVDSVISDIKNDQEIQQSATITDGNKTSQQIPTPGQTDSDPGAKYRVPKPSTGTNQPAPQSIVDSVQVHNAPTIHTGMSTAALLKALDDYRKRLLAQTVDNSDSIEQGVCSMIIDEIKEKYDDPDFRLSVIVMMYLVIRPAMEVALHLISYLNRAIFHLMFKLKWFKKYEDREVAENIE